MLTLTVQITCLMRFLCAFVTTLLLGQCALSAEGQVPWGKAIIRAPLGDSEIVITTTPRLAGAIHSVIWQGTEFIDSWDHGRQLQSAANFDALTPFTPETFNPTEAGSADDDVGDTSTSRLLHLLAQGNSLQTTTQMAFWLKPGQKSAGNLAKNRTSLSDHLLTKRVVIGYRQLPQVIQYDVTFSLPITEQHRYAQFEAVTGYMPEVFNQFWKYNASTQQLEPLSDGPGEQGAPVVLSTESGQRAMGVYSPQQPSAGFEEAGYGRFRFREARVTKWNCVFRIRADEKVPPGDYTFRSFVIIGDLKLVTDGLRELHREFLKSPRKS